MKSPTANVRTKGMIRLKSPVYNINNLTTKNLYGALPGFGFRTAALILTLLPSDEKFSSKQKKQGRDGRCVYAF
jgi:hypothetical protein